MYACMYVCVSVCLCVLQVVLGTGACKKKRGAMQAEFASSSCDLSAICSGSSGSAPFF